MQKIATKDAVGHILCHDITQIIKDVKKEPVFRKGHVVKEEDIAVLLSVGKEHLYVWEYDETKLHEDDAAKILYEICSHTYLEKGQEIKEGKIDLYAARDGMFCVNVEALNTINGVEEIVIATRHNHTPVKKGDKVAGMRVVPLVIDKQKMENLKAEFLDKQVLSLKPYEHYKVGIVTTGSEVFKGRIKDTFGPVIKEKLLDYNTTCMGQKIVDDQQEGITEAIESFIENGANMVICTGGMSVDPDDVTPTAIKAVGGEIITYGAPVLPGAMFLLSYKGDIPILGLPGCVMYAKRTVFDLVLPRIMVGERLNKQSIAALGHGGLCLGCEKCVYPNCAFGKGV
ncbi:MAG: molybdopterin-binding protein [Cellulosilyticaceae bacterium]